MKVCEIIKYAAKSKYITRLEENVGHMCDDLAYKYTSVAPDMTSLLVGGTNQLHSANCTQICNVCSVMKPKNLFHHHE